MRGISGIIELLMLTFILISLATLFWLFTSGTIGTITESGSQRIERTEEYVATCMKIDSIYKNKVYVKNCGDGFIESQSINLYLDEDPVPFLMSPDKTGKGGIATLTLDISGMKKGGHALKITSPSLQLVQAVEADYSCFDDPKCVLALDFDDGTGNTASDSSSYHNDGLLYTLSGVCSDPISYDCPQWVSGLYSTALSFDGTGNTWVQVADSNSLDLSNNFTLEAWIYPFSYATSGIIINKEDSYEFTLWSDDHIYWAFNNAAPGWDWRDTGASVSLNEWTHIAIVYDNGAIKTYRNGILMQTYPGSGSLTPSGRTLQIGEREAMNEPFNGMIDSVRIYNKTLTGEEIKNGPYANLIRMK
jgi:hypothetical protein